jgi:hypothetical protein
MESVGPINVLFISFAGLKVRQILLQVCSAKLEHLKPYFEGDE